MYAWSLKALLKCMTIYMYERSVLEVDDGEVCQPLTYKRKESIGSNFLHTIGVHGNFTCIGTTWCSVVVISYVIICSLGMLRTFK